MEPRSSSSLAASSHPRRPSSNDEPVTLSDFLRSHDYSAQPAADFERRQRRRIEAEAPAQRYRRPSPPNPTTFPGAAFFERPSSSEIMSNPPASRPSAPMQRNGILRERSSLEPLPRWQPDHEVNACPVCKTTFSFFFRKHHCRKCGRVVCNNCSPHRITIPRQYVVQPPSVENEGEVSEAYPARNLGGGEVVRVCNPCVPDPWTPEGAGQPRSGKISIGGGSQEGDTARIRQRYRSSISGSHTPLPPPNGRMRAQSHQPPPNFSRSLPGGPSNPQSVTFGSRPHYDSLASPSSSSARPRHRYTHSSGPAPPAYSTYDTRVRPLSAVVPSPSSQPHQQQPQPHRRPRREVREEDECPVCGEELPPGDEIRQQHISTCISTRFGTPSQSSTPLPSSNNAAGTPPPSTPPSGRPRAPTYRPRGMALYRATEKDCLDASGEAVECVICFEEFQPGDEMGRMECLCKFHRACIRRWWEARGAGSCPTHLVRVDE